jgi:23S rRNA pseudouridine1911/1915/1917 synthase
MAAMAPAPRVLIADRGDQGQRLDLVLRRHLGDVKGATRTRLQTWIEGGRVLVNGAPTTRVSARAVAGDVITVIVPVWTERATLTGEPLPLDVRYEDDQLLVVNKPPGTLVHPTRGHAGGTIMNALLWRARAWPAGQRPSLAGRLDRDTSGLLVVAKSAVVQATLQRVLSSRDAEKTYLAVVYGHVGPARGAVDLRLARDLHDRRRVVAARDRGLPSLTEFERLAQVAAPRAGLALLRCRLRTGRTHQIRVHLASQGWPIVADRLYGEPRWRDVDDPVIADALRRCPRQALHAWRIRFPHPVTHASVALDAPPPDDLAALVRAAGLDAGLAGTAAPAPYPRPGDAM